MATKGFKKQPGAKAIFAPHKKPKCLRELRRILDKLAKR